jgi:hypothetical protein
MPKKRPEPFWLEQALCYYVQIGKQQVRLDLDEQNAWRLYHELMARPPDEQKPSGPGLLAVEVLDAFLGWIQGNKAARTYEWYRENIQRFAAVSPPA